MGKKLHKLFVKAFDEFNKNITECRIYTSSMRKDFKNKLLSEKEYQASLWARKYPSIVRELEDYAIPRFITAAEWGLFGAYGDFRLLGKHILAEMRKGKIHIPIYSVPTEDAPKKETVIELPAATVPKDTVENQILNATDVSSIFNAPSTTVVTPKQVDVLQELENEQRAKQQMIPIRLIDNPKNNIHEFSSTDKASMNFRRGDTIIFDDGTTGEAYDTVVILVDEMPYTVNEEPKTGKKYINYKFTRQENIWSGPRSVTAFKKLYLANFTSQCN